MKAAEEADGGEPLAIQSNTRPWGARDYVDLGVIGITHGLSDGFANLLVPVLALIVADLGLSTAEAGILLSLFSLGTFLFLYPLSMLADHTGRKKAVLLGGMGVSAVAFLAMGWAPDLFAMSALAFLAGAGNACYHPCGTAMAAERFAADRPFAISYHGLGGNIGMAFMPIAQAAVASAAGWRTALASCALPAAVLLPLIGFRFQGKERDAPDGIAEGPGFRALTSKVMKNRDVVLLAVTYTLRGMGTKGMIGFLPLIAAKKLGMDTEMIGLAVSLHFAAGVVTKPIMGFLYARVGARGALFFPLLLTGGLALAMGFTTWDMALVAYAVGAGLFSHVSPIILTATADLCEKEVLASSVGFIYTCHGLSFLSPLAGGWIASGFGLEASYMFFALSIWAGVAASMRLSGRSVPAAR